MGMGTGTGTIFIQWGGDIYHTTRTHGYPFTSLVERKGVSFKLATGYAWMPDFCSHCQIISHDVTAYRWITLKQALEKLDCGKKSTPKRTIQKFVEKENPDGIGSSKAFSATALTTLPKDFISEIGNNTCSP
jgi:hypothetical protein